MNNFRLSLAVLLSLMLCTPVTAQDNKQRIPAIEINTRNRNLNGSLPPGTVAMVTKFREQSNLQVVDRAELNNNSWFSKRFNEASAISTVTTAYGAQNSNYCSNAIRNMLFDIKNKKNDALVRSEYIRTCYKKIVGNASYDNIANILFVVADEDGKKITGTAFMLDRENAITAGHVINESGLSENLSAAYLYKIESKNKTVRYKISRISYIRSSDPKNDKAMVQIESSFPEEITKIAICNDNEYEKFNKFILAGFNSYSNNLSLDPDNILADDSETCKASNYDNKNLFAHSCQSSAGTSGAPIIAIDREGVMCIYGIHLGPNRNKFGNEHVKFATSGMNIGLKLKE